jgi:hypothetical protein
MPSANLPFADHGGRPLTHGGLGRSTVWLSGGRLACSLVDHGGLETVAFFGSQADQHRQALFRAGFRSAYARVFQAQLLVGDRVYTLGVGDGALHPSGWNGRLAIAAEGLELELALVCTNQALIQAVRAVRNPRRHRLGLRLMLRDYNAVQAPGRTWSPWRVTGGVATCRVTDRLPPPAHGEEMQPGQLQLSYPDAAAPRLTRIGVVGDGLVAMRTWRSQLRAFSIAPATRQEVGLAVVFAGGTAGFDAELRRLRPGVAAAAWAGLAAWAEAERVAPRPTGLSPEVASFARQVPALLRAAMPADLPGAMRASYDSYWVWAWDSLVHAQAYPLNGMGRELADMLQSFAVTAHPKLGIFHNYDARMRPKLNMPLPGQGLFAIAAWQHWAVTGDAGPARRHWRCLTTWLARCRAQPTRDGLFTGMVLFPDFPSDLGQDGDDLSAFNNSVLYQACRCLEHLAGELAEPDTAAVAGVLATACRAGFRRRLWNPRLGYWHDSVAASTFARRPSCGSHPILWTTPFARELVDDPAAAAAFTERHHRFAGGLRMYPRWDPAFNADGNQLGQHYAVSQDPLYLRLMAMTGRQARLREWLGWKDVLWRGLTVPEGVTVEAENDGPCRPDNPGGKQMFAAKAWSDGLFGAILGISCDPGGLTIEPGLDGPLAWQGVPLHGRRWSVAVTGGGGHLGRVTVAGRTWVGTARVPLPRTGPARITIERCRKPPRHPVLRSSDGARLLASAVHGDQLDLSLEVSARTLLRIWSPRRPGLVLAGAALAADWDARSGLATAWLSASAAPVAVTVAPARARRPERTGATA